MQLRALPLSIVGLLITFSVSFSQPPYTLAPNGVVPFTVGPTSTVPAVSGYVVGGTNTPYPTPNITLELYDPNTQGGFLSASRWGIALLPGDFSALSTTEDAVLSAQEGEDLILTARCHQCQEPELGAIRLATEQTDPLHWSYQSDLERVTVASNGLVGIQHPVPQRLLNLGNRWGHDAALRFSNDVYDFPLTLNNQYDHSEAVAELALTQQSGHYSDIAGANDFVIRTAYASESQLSPNIILTTKNPEGEIKFATSAGTTADVERMRIQSLGDVEVVSALRVGNITGLPVRDAQHTVPVSLEVNDGQLRLKGEFDSPSLASFVPSPHTWGSEWAIASTNAGSKLVFGSGAVGWTLNDSYDDDAATWSTARVTLTDNGQVGIGTVSPQAVIDVVSPSNSIVGQFSSPTNGAAKLQLAVAPATYAYSTSATTGDIVLRTDNGGATEDFIIASSNPGASLKLATRLDPQSDNVAHLTVYSNGNVGIGTDESKNLHAKLGVAGTICAEEVKVLLYSTQSATCWTWPDYVFSDQYDLMTIPQLESFIAENGHLPNVPSQQEVESNGVELARMNAVLLEKIEELTLYVIELNKRIADLESQDR